MEPRRPQEHTLEVFADPSCVKDVVKAILHTIFFHRYFIPVTPKTRDLLDTTLPAVDDVDLDTLIDQRATSLARALETNDVSLQQQNMRPSTHAHTVQHASSQTRGGSLGPGVNGHSGRAQIVVQFLEKKRRKTYFSFGKDEEVIWEQWTLDVTTATPRTDTEVAKVRRAMEKSLHKTAMSIINIVNREMDHIPPILTTETNPFPYLIIVNPSRSDGQFGPRIGLF